MSVLVAYNCCVHVPVAIYPPDTPNLSSFEAAIAISRQQITPETCKKDESRQDVHAILFFLLLALISSPSK